MLQYLKRAHDIIIIRVFTSVLLDRHVLRVDSRKVCPTHGIGTEIKTGVLDVGDASAEHSGSATEFEDPLGLPNPVLCDLIFRFLFEVVPWEELHGTIVLIRASDRRRKEA